MGWDQATYKRHKDNFKNTKKTGGKIGNKNGGKTEEFQDDDDKYSENSKDSKNNLVDMKCHGNGNKCYRTPDGQVPFSVIVATILLPPMGLFMEYGITGWINIIICGMLTLMFYFPGLIYALILIYC